MILFTFLDNLSAENSKSSADFCIQRIQLLECMLLTLLKEDIFKGSFIDDHREQLGSSVALSSGRLIAWLFVDISFILQISIFFNYFQVNSLLNMTFSQINILWISLSLCLMNIQVFNILLFSSDQCHFQWLLQKWSNSDWIVWCLMSLCILETIIIFCLLPLPLPKPFWKLSSSWFLKLYLSRRWTQFLLRKTQQLYSR